MRPVFIHLVLSLQEKFVNHNIEWLFFVVYVLKYSGEVEIQCTQINSNW